MQPGADFNYKVSNSPRPILKVEFFQMTYVSVSGVKSVGLQIFNTSQHGNPLNMLLSRLKDSPPVKWLHLGRWTQDGYSLPVIVATPRLLCVLCESAVRHFKHPMNRRDAKHAESTQRRRES
jgi:hypothetical protein